MVEGPENGTAAQQENSESAVPPAHVLRATRFTRINGPEGRIEFYRREDEAPLLQLPYTTENFNKYFPTVKDQPPFSAEELAAVRQVLLGRVEALPSADDLKQALRDRINTESSVSAINSIDDDIYAIEHPGGGPSPALSGAEAVAPGPATREAAPPMAPEELEVLKGLLKFSQIYKFDPKDQTNSENFATVVPALRAAVEGSVENIWPTLRDRIQTDIPNPPMPAVLDYIWGDLDKASLNLRPAVAPPAAPPAAPAQAPAAPAQVPQQAPQSPRQPRGQRQQQGGSNQNAAPNAVPDWQRDRDYRIHSAVERVQDLYFGEGKTFDEAVAEARETLQPSDEVLFGQQVRQIPGVDKRTAEAALRKRTERSAEPAAPTQENYADSDHREVVRSARKLQEENERLRKL